MSHKILAVIAEVQFEPENNLLRLQTSVGVRDTLNPSAGFKFDTNIYVDATETANQLNTKIVNQIKSALTEMGITHVTDNDILVNKFV